MFNPQKAILPGILIGSLILVLTARFLTAVEPAAAATPVPQTAPQTTAKTNSSGNTCSLNTLPAALLPWCDLIEQNANKYSVPATLVAAVMLQESGGQSAVISSSGAVGLLQVMPKDGIAASFMCQNGPCFASRPSTQELLDPGFNIDYGVKMLANLINKYGNSRDALKAYGPYNVEYYYADKVLTIQKGL
jgi:soluble lytic murein transglycosylase-like protein